MTDEWETVRTKFEGAPVVLIAAFIVAGLALWFSDLWVQESTLEHNVLGGFGLLLAIYCSLIICKRRRPSGRA